MTAATTRAHAQELTEELERATAYAHAIAVVLHHKHWRHTAPDWKPLDDLYGLLTQIDNMTCGMVRQGSESA
ncbi:hypothetical protein [Paraburkholderia sp. HD33-4]|uniref:hypothetical protein n=1 Tax=Paraburkholderia sp. HD33-4 TaxID=2883242 RepID=UPI001F22F84D|nr:hypothetical protein [Paraburkholderia sp. HD33-4]